MARKILDLATLSWQMGRVARQPFDEHPVDDRGQVVEWLPAVVPGDVRADLMAAGRIPPIDSPAGIASGAWVDGYDWWYRTTVPADFGAGQSVWLEADGIDFYSAIWLDGRLIATHAGMFARQTLQLWTPQAEAGYPGAEHAAGTEHELAIRVWGGGAVLPPAEPARRRLLRNLLRRLHPGLDYFSERMAVPKAQYGFGWDFAPRVLSAGIWDGIRLVAAGDAYIEDLWARGEPLVAGEDPCPVRWHVRLRVRRQSPRPLRTEVVIEPANFGEAGYQALARDLAFCNDAENPCAGEQELTVEMPSARRWWPWDQGDPCLYSIRVRLLSGGRVLDEAEVLAATRTVERVALPSGAPWQFTVNERPVFLRGANWAPVSMLPGTITVDDYARLLGQARDAGINFLRVWGGGLREKRAFWDLCDRMGLLAWQEFPLACDFLDHYPDDGPYLDLLACEAASTVRLLRGHPSLIAWCGGNELDVPREQAALTLLADVVAEHDGTRPWIEASPSDGDVHQWDVWHGLAPWTMLGEGDPPFMSEFGLQALPALETVAEMFPDGAPSSLSARSWRDRKAQPDKLRHYAAGEGRDLAGMVLASQRVQAAALQLGVEACRLRQVACGGVAVWQLNEPWPAVSWAIIDHAGRPKRAYHTLATSYQPLLVAARFPRRHYAPGEEFTAELWLANDAPIGYTGCRLEVALDGEVVWAQDQIEVPGGGVQWVSELHCHRDRPPALLALRLWGPAEPGAQPGAQPGAERGAEPGAQRGEGSVAEPVLLAHNAYDLTVPLPRPRPAWARLFRWIARRVAGV